MRKFSCTGLRVVFTKPNDPVVMSQIGNPSNFEPLIKMPVRFTVTKVGVTEIISADGWVTQYSLHVKALRMVSRDEHGKPAYEVDVEIVPKLTKALTNVPRAIGETEN